ncbi:hypothetical protein Tco_0949686 [Tanacetum coccineum]
MTTTFAQQVSLDNALVPLEKRVEIGKYNMRINPAKTQKEPTYQVVLDAFVLTTCYPAFLITTSITKVVVDHMYQPWRTFAAIINKCLSRKIIGLDKLRLSKAQILWEMFYKKNVNFVELLWEDFTFQIENKDHKKQEKICYPKFTKAIIHHFITKDKSILMRNIIFMHTARDDSILGTMRFVSKFEDFQIYGAVLPNRMTNQHIRDSAAYMTYLAYATGAASPKMKRKLKKPSSLSKKRTLVTVEEEEPKPAKKLYLLRNLLQKDSLLVFESETLLEAQLEKALKRSKRETTIHQAGGSSEGVDSESEVPNEPKASMNHMGDGGEEDVDDQQGDDERTESDDEPTEADNPKTSDDEEEIQDDEFVHTPKDYVPTDDESNDVTKKEYERINEEIYGDVNVNLTDTEPDDKEKDDEEMTVVGHVNVNQEGAGNQVKDDAPATQKTEVPRTSSLLTIPVSVIPQQDVINQFETVTATSTPTISSLLSSLYPALQQITPIPTPTTTEATTLTAVVPDSESLTALHQRITDLEKDVKEHKDVDNSIKVISTIQSEVPKAVKEYLGSSLDDAMHKVIQKNIADIIKEHSVPTKTVERLRQQYAPQKSVEDIREIKMEHARKQQVPKETITSSNTTALIEFD